MPDPNCFMCHGTGKHALAYALPAGVEIPPVQMVECQQCKSPSIAMLSSKKPMTYDEFFAEAERTGMTINDLLPGLVERCSAIEQLAYAMHQAEYPNIGYRFDDFKEGDDFDFFMRMSMVAMSFKPVTK